MNVPGPQLLTVADLDQLIRLLQADGHTCIGPSLRDGAIILDEIRDTSDLPRGWTDQQGPGSYRLAPREDAALFGYNVGPRSWKHYLFPPAERLWRMAIGPADWTIIASDRAASPMATPTMDDPAEPAADIPQSTRQAFIGVRACELAAIRRQDRVFADTSHTGAGTRYHARRASSFIVTVQCLEAGANCFCTSMATGPAAGPGSDLILTELAGPETSRFIAQAASPAGEQILARLGCSPAAPDDVAAVQAGLERAATQMGRHLDTHDLPARLLARLDSPHWDDVASRCLACANCTLSCPTCFCSRIEDRIDLDGQHAERWEHWDACFNPGFSGLHGGEVRTGTAHRYRQWLVHKLATWHEQFGTSGCVGCGRCITWCPVGIDLTAEVRQLEQAPTS